MEKTGRIRLPDLEFTSRRALFDQRFRNLNHVTGLSFELADRVFSAFSAELWLRMARSVLESGKKGLAAMQMQMAALSLQETRPNDKDGVAVNLQRIDAYLSWLDTVGAECPKSGETIRWKMNATLFPAFEITRA